MQGTTQITVVGNLVKEPFVREPSGYFVLRGTVAVNKKLKGKESTLFLEFEFWGTPQFHDRLSSEPSRLFSQFA